MRHSTAVKVCILLLTLIAPAAGQTASADRRQARAASVAGSPPTIDGRLDEAAWDTASEISGFLQKQPEEGAPPMERTEVRILDRNLRRLVPFGFSGAVSVVKHGRRIHTAGYGFADRGTQRSNTSETTFDIGSLSKQFTAAAVLLMAERGLLSLTDSIGEHLPYVPEDKRGITVHHLLTQTSGLPQFHAFSAGDVHGDFLVMSRRGAERAIMGSPLGFPPGEGWTYSNAGYTLLANIVERVADRPFEEVLRSELFEPAGLSHTGLYFQSGWDEVTVARGYRESGDQGSPLSWTDTEELWALIGNGGVLSTLGDLRRWDRALREGTVLSRDAVQRLFAPHVQVRKGLHYGYGWYIDDGTDFGPVIRHGGANDFGFASRWRRYEDEDVWIVVLLNRGLPGMDVSLAADAVMSVVVESAVLGSGIETPPETAGTEAASPLDRYAGRYRLDDGSELVVRRSMDALAVEPRGSRAVRALAFPTATEAELEPIRRLDRQADEILDGIIRNDYGRLARALADSSRLEAYRNYISGWWTDFKDAGGRVQDMAVAGTVPTWWRPGDDRLATLIRASRGDRSQVFRLHWRDGRLAGLGGGAIREPATTVFAATDSGDFVGYHLGIRRPVSLSFEEDSAGRITALRLHSRAGSVRAQRLRE